MTALLLVLTVALGAQEAPAVPERPKLLVTTLNTGGGASAEIAGALGEAITAEIAARGYFAPLSARDVEAIAGAERNRQLLGCSTDESTCLAELAGAMGARFVLNGTLARLGKAYQLTLQTLDTTRAQPLGRSVRIAQGLEELRATLPWAVAEATSTPLPAPPSRVVPYSVITAGGLAFLGGALATFDSLGRESRLSEELRRGTTDPSALQPLEAYRTQSGQISLQRGLGIGVMAAGVALAGLGLWLMPPSTTGASALMVPTQRGVALVGVFP